MKKFYILFLAILSSISMPLIAFAGIHQISGKVKFIDEKNRPFPPQGSFRIIIQGNDPRTGRTCGGTQFEPRVDPHPETRGPNDKEYNFLYPVPIDCQNLTQLKISFKLGTHENDWKPVNRSFLYVRSNDRHAKNLWNGPEPSPIAILRSQNIDHFTRDRYFNLGLKAEFSDPEEAKLYFSEAARGDDTEYTLLATERLMAVGSMQTAKNLLLSKNIETLDIKNSQKAELMEELANIEEELGEYSTAAIHYQMVSSLNPGRFQTEELNKKIANLLKQNEELNKETPTYFMDSILANQPFYTLNDKYTKFSFEKGHSIYLRRLLLNPQYALNPLFKDSIIGSYNGLRDTKNH